MKENRYTDSGRIFVQQIRDLIVISGVIGVVLLLVCWLGRGIFGDTAVENLVHELSERAMDVSMKLSRKQENIPFPLIQDTTKQGYPLSVYVTDNHFFEIVLENVPSVICKSLQARHGAQVTSVYVNGILRQGEDIPCQKSNQIGFEFQNDLSEGVSDSDKPRRNHCQSNADCDLCSVCQNGMCHSKCSNGEACGMNLNGQGVCCSGKQFDNPMCCSYMNADSCCWGSGKCCPKNKPIRLRDGTCTDCYDTQIFAVGVPASVETCLKLCPNREAFGADELCMLPVCGQNQFTDRSGNCVNCLEGGTIVTSQKECQRCPNRTYENGKCLLPCPKGTVSDKNGSCHKCDSLTAVVMKNRGECPVLCSNREDVKGRCALKTCPAGFIRNAIGDCLSCGNQNALDYVDENVCLQCPGREMVSNQCVKSCPIQSFRDVNGRCVSCFDPEAVPVLPGECQRCPNRLALKQYCFADCGQGKFRDKLGVCRSCLDFRSYPVDRSFSCAVCPNRSILLYQNEGKDQSYCRPQSCPINYFTDRFGGCHDCFDKEVVRQTDRHECEKCLNRFWSANENTCLLKKRCPVGQILDSDGHCQACSTNIDSFPVAGRTRVCDSCPNRYVYGTWCRLCPSRIQALKTKEGCLKCGGKWDNRIARCQP